MAIVMKEVSGVLVSYNLVCGYERATALAQDLCQRLKDDKGFESARDDTRRWHGDRKAEIEVCYRSLEDANRLDQTVRRLLSRTVDFSIQWHHSITYSGPRPSAIIRASSAVTERRPT